MALDTRPKAMSYPKAAYFVQLKPMDRRSTVLWTVRLESEVLTLMDPNNSAVISLHRDEAIRYLDFKYDLISGLVLTFTIIEHVKTLKFRCSRDQFEKLLSWLPHVDPEDVAQHIRNSGIVMILYGVFHFLMHWWGSWVWGLALVGIGVYGFQQRKRKMFLYNGILSFLAGLWDLVMRMETSVQPTAMDLGIAIIGGVVLILWSIQQFSMLGIRHQIRGAKRVRDEQMDFLPAQSALVQKIGRFNLGVSIALGLYVFALLLIFLFNGPGPTPEARDNLLIDFLVFGILDIFSVASGFLFLRHKRPAYDEAKLSAQFLISVLSICVWTIGFCIYDGHPMSFAGALLKEIVGLSPHTYLIVAMLASMLITVMMFNRWFMRILDRELEEQRG